MIGKKYYRVPTSIPDAAMLLGEGIEFTRNGTRIRYDKAWNNAFRVGNEGMAEEWSSFKKWVPIMPEPSWSDKASTDNPIPCFVWHATRNAAPSMRYVAGTTEDGYYILLEGGMIKDAEPIRTEDK